jgi:hypothetical protein
MDTSTPDVIREAVAFVMRKVTQNIEENPAAKDVVVNRIWDSRMKIGEFDLTSLETTKDGVALFANFCKVVRASRTLTTLGLRNMTVSELQLNSLIKAVGANAGIKSFVLDAVTVRPSDIDNEEKRVDFLPLFPSGRLHLTSIQLDSIRVPECDWTSLFAKLCEPVSIVESFSVKNWKRTGLSYITVAHDDYENDLEPGLIHWLKLPTSSLRRLNVSRNSIGARIKYLCSAIVNNPRSRLTEFVCETCDLDLVCLEDMTALISNSHGVLKVLNFSDNRTLIPVTPISEQRAAIVSWFFRACAGKTSLERILCMDCGFKKPHVEQLFSLLADPSNRDVSVREIKLVGMYPRETSDMNTDMNAFLEQKFSASAASSSSSSHISQLVCSKCNFELETSSIGEPLISSDIYARYVLKCKQCAE